MEHGHNKVRSTITVINELSTGIWQAKNKMKGIFGNVHYLVINNNLRIMRVNTICKPPDER
jgi:hypothetical protein